MRYLAYLLLVANIAYFAWNHFNPQQAAGPIQVVPVPPGINPLVLLSERADQPERVSAAPVETERVEPDDVPGEEETMIQASEENGVTDASMDTEEEPPAEPVVHVRPHPSIS